jgi:plastocyanin
MATNFPTSKDTLINPASNDSVQLVPHASQHANANDAIEALQTKVGANGSIDTDSHDYKIANLASYAISYETAQDAAGALFGHTDHTNLIATYDDVANQIRLSVAAPDVARTIYQTAINDTGATITKGSPVYISGSEGASKKLKVSLASSNSELLSSKTFGIAAENISVNSEGQIITEGLLQSINTIGASDGDPVWLGVTPGSKIFGLADKPHAPQHLVFLGIVVSGENANNGSIFVKIQNGFELREIHDVLIQSPANQNALVYDSTTGLWKNYDLSQFLATKTYADASATTALNTAKSYTDTSISNLIDAAPGALDTLNELAAAINDDASFAATVTTSLGTKLNSSDAANTYLALENTDERIQDVVGGMVSSNTEGGIEVTYDDPTGKLNFSVTPELITDFVESAQDASAALLNHSDHNKITATYDDINNKVVLNVDEPIKVSVSAPVNPINGDSWFDNETGVLYVYDGSFWIEVSGGTGFTASAINDLPESITYLSDVTSNIQAQLNLKSPINSPVFTGAPSSTTPAVDTNTSAIATTEYVINQQYAKKASPTFTGEVTLPSTTSIGNVSSQEIEFINGVTSSIQTQINTKSSTVSPTFTGTVVLPTTTSIGNISNIELLYLDGVTSSIQTQINSKLATSGFTYSAITKVTYSSVGLLPAAASNTGKIFYVTADGYAYYSNGATWVKLAKFNDTTSLAFSINALTDVDTSTVTPTINQVLKWNGTKWVPSNQTSSSGGSTTLSGLTDVNTSSAAPGNTLTYSGSVWQATDNYIPTKISDLTNVKYEVNSNAVSSINILDVTSSGTSGYVFGEQYNNDINPNLWAISGTTIAFALNTPGHPFLIQTFAGTNYDIGLKHIAIDSTVTSGSSAQGKTSGILYWKIPIATTGNYKYQCSIHAGMNGVITIKDLRTI